MAARGLFAILVRDLLGFDSNASALAFKDAGSTVLRSRDALEGLAQRGDRLSLSL